MNIPDKNSNQALHLISEILDKMIDMQSASTEAITSQKSSVESISKGVSSNLELSNSILAHFSNGFRSEIKAHIDTRCEDLHYSLDNQIKEAQKQIDLLVKQNEKLCDIISSPWHWIKLILATVTATAGAIGAIVVLIAKMMHLAP